MKKSIPSGFLRYLSNTSWLLAEQVLRILSGLLVGIWVARYLGPDNFGRLSYVLAISAIFSSATKLGLDAVVVRELIHHPYKRDDYLGTAFWLKLSAALLTLIGTAAALQHPQSDPTTTLFITIVVGGLLFQSFEVIDFFFQSRVQAKKISICKTIQVTISAILRIYLVLLEADLIWFVAVTLIDAITLSITYLYAYKKQEDIAFLKHFNMEIAKKYAKDCWPLALSAIVVMTYMRIDQIMIREIQGTQQLGIYSAAVRVSEAFYFLPTLISASLFPAILNSKRIGSDFYQKRMQQLYTLMIWLSIAVALPVSIYSEWIILNLYGPQYQAAASILSIHAWAIIFVALTVSSGKYLTSEGATKKILFRNTLGMLLNIGLNIQLIPTHGGNGAAVATLTSWLFAGYLYDFIDKSQWKVATQKSKGFLGATR